MLLFKVIVQGPVPEHPPPDQPVKVDPASAEAVSVTLVPIVKSAWHVWPQLIPAGLLDKVPLPVPDLDTLRVYCVWTEVMVTSDPADHPETTAVSLLHLALTLTL